jgi:hypothetical protein
LVCSSTAFVVSCAEAAELAARAADIIRASAWRVPPRSRRLALDPWAQYQRAQINCTTVSSATPSY